MIAVGVLLLVLGIALFAVEAHAPTYGSLGVPGAAALIAGAALLVAGVGGGVALVVVVAAMLTLATVGTLRFMLPAAGMVRRRRVRSGPEALVGQVGVVQSWGDARAGHVFVDGALWRARLAPPLGSLPGLDGDRASAAGDAEGDAGGAGADMGAGPAGRANGARATHAEDHEEALHPGDLVIVEHRNGLTLAIRRAEQWEVSP
jgi:membrane-bound serine protease (ClpP class)